MKRTTLFCLSLLFATTLFAQDKTYGVEAFHAVRAGSHYNVVMEQGDRHTVRLEGDEEAVRRVEVEVKDGTLHLGWENDRNWRNNNGRVTAYVTYQQVDEVTSSGSGNLTCRSALTGDRVKVRNSGSGNMSVAEITADELEISNSGSGNLDLAGRVKHQDIRVSGSGNVRAFDLKSEQADVSISGSSNVDLHVTEALEARISGSGDVRYRGQPKMERLRVSGSGEIRSAN